MRRGSIPGSVRLQSFIAPNVKTVEDYNLLNMSALTTLSLPKLETAYGCIGNLASITSLELPALKVAHSVFQDCPKLTSLVIPECAEY